jgi:hypothetical protein
LLERHAAGRYQPATFPERGIALPLTTPSLLGGRIRPGPRGGAELVLANPAGVEGVFILPWPAVLEYCAPTLHDRALWARLGRLDPLTPRSVRAAARGVAAEGSAGRAAARAAASAEKAESQARILTNYHLLMALVRQEEPDGGANAAPPPEQDTPAQVERRARAVLERLRGQGGLTPARAVDILEELALAFAPLGLRHDPTLARLPRTIAEIATVSREVALWGERGGAEDRLCARLLVQSAELTLRWSRIALDQALALLDDMSGLMGRWSQDPAPLQALAARPEWLLDGWDLLCGLWRASAPEQQPAALLDMVCMVPTIPTEVGGWPGCEAGPEMEAHRAGLRRWRRQVPPSQDRQAGRLLDLVHRNETARTLAA